MNLERLKEISIQIDKKYKEIDDLEEEAALIYAVRDGDEIEFYVSNNTNKREVGIASTWMGQENPTSFLVKQEGKRNKFILIRRDIGRFFKVRSEK